MNTTSDSNMNSKSTKISGNNKVDSAEKTEQILRTFCKKCNSKMKPGKAIEQTWTAGLPDFANSDDMTCRTVSAGGPGKLVDCLKCERCGWSTT